MLSKFHRLSLSARLYLGLVGVLLMVFGLIWWHLREAEAAPCPPLQACVPLPTLPAPQAFATPTPSPTANPSPQPTVVPGPGGVLQPGQDVGVTALAQASAGSASGLSKQVNNQLTAPNLQGNWFKPLYERVTRIAIYVLLACLVLAAIQFLVHKQFGIVAGSWFGWAPGSIAITALGVTITNLLLAITDGFTLYMLQGMGADVPGFLLHLASVLALVAAGSALTGNFIFVAGFLAVLILVALVGILAELLMRQVVIYVCLLWLPLVAAASVWHGARQWLYRLATLQFAVILSKFAIVVVLALGVAAFAADPRAVGPLGDPNLVDSVMGLMILAVALLSPYVLLRLLPHDFDHAASGVSGGIRKLTRKATRRLPRSLGQRWSMRQAGRAGLPIATKGGYAVVPLSLVLKGGRVIAARGGKVIHQGRAKGHRKPKPAPNKSKPKP